MTPMLSRWTALLGLGLLPLAQAATVAITPSGDVQPVRQISLRFDSPMVALGQSDATAPASVRCTHPNPRTRMPAGAGRWINERDWAWEFASALPAGTRCEVQRNSSLRNQAGEAVQGDTGSSFRILPTGFHNPRTLQAFAPGQAHYAWLLQHPDPAGARQSLATNPLVCDVLRAGDLGAALGQQDAQGRANVTRWLHTMPTTPLSPQQVQARFAPHIGSDTRWDMAVQCAQPLPDGAKVRLRRQNDDDRLLVHGEFQHSDSDGRERFALRTREPFTATLSCMNRPQWRGPQPVRLRGTKAPATDALQCDARLPIQLSLSSPIATGAPSDWPQLIVNGQSLAPQPQYNGSQQREIVAFEWRVNPDTVSAPLNVRLSGQPLVDPMQRPLANASVLQQSFTLLPAPPYLGAVPPTAPVQPLRGPADMRQMLFATRKLEAELPLAQWQLGPLDSTAKLRAAAALQNPLRQRSADDWQALLAQAGAKPLAPSTIKPASDRLGFAAIPLSQPGLHVARVRSATYDQLLQAQAEADRSDQSSHKDKLPPHPGERWHVAQLSNLAVSSNLSRRGDSLLWVTAIDTAKPVAGARVSLLDCSLNTLWQGQSDAQGVARVPASTQLPDMGNCRLKDRSTLESRNLYGQQWWVLVQQGDDQLLTPVQRGHVPNSTWQSHLVLDRTLLRVGETLHLQLIARQATASGFKMPEMQAVRINISHESGESVGVLPGIIDPTGQLSLSWQVPANAKLGTYSVQVQSNEGEHGEQLQHQTDFRVEEFRRPVFDASLRTQATPGARQLVVDGQLKFFAGGSAAGTAVQWRHDWSADISEPVEGYSFYTPLKGQPKVALVSDTPSTLDAQGQVQRKLNLPAMHRPMTLNSAMRFADPNGETQTVNSRVTVWPTAWRLGLRWQQADHRQSARVAGVLIDAQDKPLANQRVRVQVAQAKSAHEQETVWTATEAARTLCEAVTNAQGLWHCAWPTSLPAMDGQHARHWLVSAQLPSQAAVHTDLVVNGWEIAAQTRSDELQVLGPKELNAGGSTQILARPDRLPATLLLTTEREGVRSHRVLSLNALEQTIPLSVTAVDAPNIHLRAQYVYPWQAAGGHSQAPDGPDARAAAGISAKRVALPRPEPAPGTRLHQQQTAELTISPAPHALQVQVKPQQAEVRPRAQLPVALQVRDAQGKPAANARITVAVVDEALLALRPNPTWALRDAMWAPRPNQVSASSMLDRVALMAVAPPAPSWIGPDESAVTLYGAMDMGGSGRSRVAMAPASPAPAPAAIAHKLADKQVVESDAQGPRSEFGSLLLWQTQVQTDAQGRAQLTVPVNDSLTRFRVVAIAAQGASQFGEGEASFSVTQPLQLMSGLPEVLRAGDELVQQLTVRNASQQAMNVTLTAQAERVGSDSAPALRALDAAAQAERGLTLNRQIQLAPGSNQTVLWRLRVPEGVSQLKWQFSASSPGKQAVERDTLLIDQRVLPAIEPTVRSATLLQLSDAPNAIAVAQPTGALPLVGGVRVNLAASLVQSSLQETRRWMRDYPYSCLEQQSARALVLDDRAAWDALMAQLPKYLDNNGFARFFPESSLSGSELLTLQLLDWSKATGWAIPEDSKARLLAAVQHSLRKGFSPQDWTPRPLTQPYQLAAQATLAEHGQPLLVTQPQDIAALAALPAQSLIDWARTLAALPADKRPSGAVGDAVQVSNQLRSRFDVQGTVLRWRNEADTQWWWYMWSGDSAAARMALLAQQLGGADKLWQADAPRIIQGLVARQQAGRWYSTTANAWSAVALAQFAKTREAGPVSGASVIQLGQAERRVTWADQQAPAQLLPWPQQGAQLPLSLQHAGSGKPWATVATLAAVPLKAPVAHGLSVKREVLPIEQRKPGQWHVGDAYRVRLTVTANAPQTWVVVRDALPSGATPLNRGLGRDGQLATQDQDRSWRSHPSFEENAADSYRAYYRWVAEGSWTVDYTVRLNNAGNFELPPTRVEAMYAPEVFGEAPAQAIQVLP